MGKWREQAVESRYSSLHSAKPGPDAAQTHPTGITHAEAGWSSHYPTKTESMLVSSRKEGKPRFLEKWRMQARVSSRSTLGAACGGGPLSSPQRALRRGARRTGFSKVSRGPCACCPSWAGPCGVVRPQKSLYLKSFNTVWKDLDNSSPYWFLLVLHSAIN